MVRPLTHEQHQKTKELKRMETKREAESWVDEANSDEPEDLPRPGATADRRKTETLVQLTIRVHPEVYRVLNDKAAEDRKVRGDVARDFILKGMRADGIEV